MGRFFVVVIAIILVTASFSYSTTYAVSAKNPAKVSIISAKASGNSITIKYKKVKGAKKYQIAYKVSTAKKWKTKRTKALKYVINNRQYNTKYKVKVRAYNGKWGKWSAVKAVTTAKRTALAKLTSIATTPYSSYTVVDNYGNTYKSAITNNCGYNGSAGPVQYEYLINGAYKKIKGTLYVPLSFAVFIPSAWHSRRFWRSNSLIAAIIVSIGLPVGVDVSRFSLRLTRFTFFLI